LPDRSIYTTDDTLRMLDRLLADRGGAWWDTFFADRAKPCPFFVDQPDENLVEWFDQGRLSPGRVLELGTGQGRNATYLAGRGCSVEAVDFSAEALRWAGERAAGAGVAVNFVCGDIFDVPIAAGGYDLVYDSGCFHHLAPHRRRDYVELVRRALAPGGAFGLVCFGPDGGSGLTDQQVYEQRSLGGGLGYDDSQLRALWDVDPWVVEVLRPMRAQGAGGSVFGVEFLSVLLARLTG
jgi:SAM-dependent methyltransferase